MSTRGSERFRLAWGWWVLIGFVVLTLLLLLASQGLTARAS